MAALDRPIRIRTMAPSQLRRLAESHAQGAMDRDSYRERRRTLIDGITGGTLTLEREADPVHAHDEGEPKPSRNLWMPGAIALVLVVGGLVIGLGGRDTARTNASSTLTEVNAPRSQVRPARSLVESFLARRDFSAEAMERFERTWDDLNHAEVARARDSQWFASLGTAIADEIRTQIALAEIGSTAPARERAARLRNFAAHIGASLPERAPAHAEGQPPVARVEAHQNLSGPRWLEIQDGERITLQLFAVNGLDHVSRLMQRYQNLDMYVLETQSGAPRYRVVHGIFDGVDEAEVAYGALPDDIRSLSHGAIIKSIAALREDLSPRAYTPAESVAPARDFQGEYTLQLFATENEANARALIEAFPSLGLESVRVPSSTSSHRVVLGRFDSVDAARSARDGLPEALVQRIGHPLIKQRESLGLR